MVFSLRNLGDPQDLSRKTERAALKRSLVGPSVVERPLLMAQINAADHPLPPPLNDSIRRQSDGFSASNLFVLWTSVTFAQGFQQKISKHD